VTSPRIDIAPDVDQYFEGIVRQAIEDRDVEVSDAAGHYLALLLSGYARGEWGPEALDRPVTFLLHDALEAEGMERFQRLRAIGDGVLYVLGFFGGARTRHGADRQYVMSIGARAYEHASGMMRLGGGSVADGDGLDVLGELSRKYDRLVEVVTEVADGAMARGDHDDAAVLRLYERWRQTGSTRLAEALGDLGITPVRKDGGVH